jgi:hypothetical protein
VQAYQATGNREFLSTAEDIDSYFFKNLPKDYVPYWDFDATVSRRQASEALVTRLMSASIAATAVITAVRAAISPRIAAERPATPSLALRA